MSEDVRNEEAANSNDDKTDRRDFLKQAGMIGGGALAAIAGLASAADAQQDIRIRPQGRMGNIQLPERQLPAIQMENVASVEEFSRVFAEMKSAYPPETSPELDEAALGQMAEMMAEMSASSRAGGVSILQMRHRFKDSPNVGHNLVVLFSTIGAGMEQFEDGGIDPRAMGNGCGSGCGTGCGTGCMSAVASGFICGDGCGQGCNGAESAGLMCGGGCEATGLKQLSFDREGMALEGVRMKGLNMKSTAAAMRNADRAYSQVFG
jgi:hypothetical protein